MGKHTIITIGRQFGSAGHTIGKKVAEMLNIGYYDKDLIAMAARESGLSEKMLENMDEQPTNSFLYSLVMGMQAGHNVYNNYTDMFTPDNVFLIQSKVIKGIAEKESGVIVGRCSDYVLRDYDNVVNIFIHADKEFKIKRIMDIHNKTREEAIDMINKKDKKRKSYYNFYTNNVWGDVSNYHLSIDSSAVGIENAAKIIVDFINLKCGEII